MSSATSSSSTVVSGPTGPAAASAAAVAQAANRQYMAMSSPNTSFVPHLHFTPSPVGRGKAYASLLSGNPPPTRHHVSTAGTDMPTPATSSVRVGDLPPPPPPATGVGSVPPPPPFAPARAVAVDGASAETARYVLAQVTLGCFGIEPPVLTEHSK